MHICSILILIDVTCIAVTFIDEVFPNIISLANTSIKKKTSELSVDCGFSSFSAINQNLFLFSFIQFFFLCVSIQSSLRIKLLTPTSLAVYNVGRSDKGMYQCLVTNKGSSAQAMAELKLGGKLKSIFVYFSINFKQSNSLMEFSFLCVSTSFRKLLEKYPFTQYFGKFLFLNSQFFFLENFNGETKLWHSLIHL